MLGGVTRHMLSHLPGVPHPHVNRPLIWNTAQGISFQCECHIIMQIQYTKNLNPGEI